MWEGWEGRDERYVPVNGRWWGWSFPGCWCYHICIESDRPSPLQRMGKNKDTYQVQSPTRVQPDLLHHFDHTTYTHIITKPLDMLGLLESCGPYRAESNIINMERQKYKRCSLLECRAVVTANLQWALKSLTVQELAFFWSQGLAAGASFLFSVNQTKEIG